MTDNISSSSPNPLSNSNSQASSPSVGPGPFHKEMGGDSGQTHTVYGMQMDEKQYKKFMAGLMQSTIQQIKSDESSYTQTQQQILNDEQEENG